MKFQTNYQPTESPFLDQTGEISMTVQSEADDCDINTIMEKFNRSGKLPTMQQLPAQYGDARVVDYQSAQQIVKDAKDQFASLPAKTRKAFGNDPQAFMEALNDESPDNVKNLFKLGILVEIKPTPEEMLNQIALNTRPVPAKPDDKK